MTPEQRRILGKTVAILWRAFDSIRGKIAMVAFILLLVNRPVARRLSDLNGISPAWALLPIGLVFLWSLIQWLIKSEAERDELLKELGRLPAPEPGTQRSAIQHMLTGGLIALSLVAMGIVVGAEIISPPVDFSGWHFTERPEKDGLKHDLVDSSGRVIATFRDQDTVTEVSFGISSKPSAGGITTDDDKPKNEPKPPATVPAK
jgi:hypothetical protein